VNSLTTFDVSLPAADGQAVWMTPEHAEVNH